MTLKKKLKIRRNWQIHKYYIQFWDLYQKVNDQLDGKWLEIENI